MFTFYAFSFAKNGSTLYAGTSNGVYRSINDGASWTPINSGMEFSWIYSMAAIPNGSGVTLFAVRLVMRSTNNGATWTPANNGMTQHRLHLRTRHRAERERRHGSLRRDRPRCVPHQQQR